MYIFRLPIIIWALFLSFQPFLFAAYSPSASIHIPMKDGIELTADLYYPPNSTISNEFPCILLRLPGGRKAQAWLHLTDLAKHGYVVAIQDTRKAIDRDGETFPYFSDGWEQHQDGYDTINWLAKSSFTNGNIGTIGFSAAGITQLLLAPTAPPGLKCQYIGQAPGSLYHHVIYPGGRLKKNEIEVWFSFYAPHPNILKLVQQHADYQQFWEKGNTLPLSHQVNVPGFHYVGWFDPFLQGTIDAFSAKQTHGAEGAKGQQKLLIGPWNHYWPQDFSLGDFKVPQNGRNPPIDVSAERWFAHYLKGIENEASNLPTIIYYVMGPFDDEISSGNLWRYANSWPVPSINTPFYLTDKKTLSEESNSQKASFSYLSNPDDPVPTIGGKNLFLPSGPKDQRPNENRKDIHVFTSSPLNEDMEVTGPLAFTAYISTQIADIDIAVRLSDVYPDGRSILIAEGLSRIECASKGNIQEIVVDLASTSIVFAKGHSIRISLAGSNYPQYEKSTHKISQESQPCFIYVGKEFPSHLALPVVRKGSHWLAEVKIKEIDTLNNL